MKYITMMLVASMLTGCYAYVSPVLHKKAEEVCKEWGGYKMANMNLLFDAHFTITCNNGLQVRVKGK